MAPDGTRFPDPKKPSKVRRFTAVMVIYVVGISIAVVNVLAVTNDNEIIYNSTYSPCQLCTGGNMAPCLGGANDCGWCSTSGQCSEGTSSGTEIRT